MNSFLKTKGFHNSRNENCSSKTITKENINCYDPSFVLSWADLGFII